MRKSVFLSVLAAVTILGFLLPVPDFKMLLWVVDSLRSRSSIAIAGNSVLVHVSRCDDDQHNLPALLAETTGKPVLDLGFNGQTIRESVNLLGAALRNRNVHDIIAAVPVFALSDEAAFTLQNYLTFRVLNPGLAESLSSRILSGHGLSGAAPGTDIGFTYRGIAYPDYNGIAAQYFAPEARSMPCPEADGRNRRFIEAYYYHVYVGRPIEATNIQLLAALSRSAERRGKRLIVALMPIDYDLMGRLRPDLPALVRRRVAAVVAALASNGVKPLDLTAALPNDRFADRYCACGHLLASGRQEIVALLGRQLSADAKPRPVDTVSLQTSP